MGYGTYMSTFSQLGTSEERLWKLVGDRCETGANVEKIDQKIWDLFGEKWSILFTDLSGFSRGVQNFGIIHFLQIIHEHNCIVAPIIDAHQGFLLKAEGDSLMVLFRRPASALACSIAMQQACQRVSQRRTAEEAILLCVGLGYGDVLRVGEHEVFGAEVNAASKLGEDTAEAHEILVTDAFIKECGDLGTMTYEPLDVVIPGTHKAYRVNYMSEE